MTAAHYQTLTLNSQLREWVPEHEPREKDPTYRLFHRAKMLLKRHDVPCWRCGVCYAQLVKKGDPATDANPLAAYQLEAHHNDLEFSLLNGVDVEKWWAASEADANDPATQTTMELGLVQTFSNIDGWLKNHQEYHVIFAPNTSKDVLAKWHLKVFQAYMESEGNLMQLCDVCHRSKDQGIHHIPYPDWRGLRTIWKAGDPAHIQ